MPRSNFQNGCIKVYKELSVFQPASGDVIEHQDPALPSLSSPGVPEQECSCPGPLGDDFDGNQGGWVALSRDSRVVSVFMLSKCRLSGVPFIKRDGFLFYIQLYYSNSVDTVGLCYFSLGLKLP